MSFTRTFTGLIQKRLQYIEEVTYGVTPSSAPTFISAGKIKRFNFNIDAQINRYRAAGLRKVSDFLNTGQMTSFEIEYQPINTDLMAYGINDPVGTGTIAKSLSFLYSKLLNGTEYYFIIKGAKTDQIQIEVTKEAVNVTQSFLAREAITPISTTNAGLTTPTFATPMTGKPWVGRDGGVDAFVYDGTTWDTPRLSCEIAWNLDPGQPIGHDLIKFLDPTNKDCNVDFDVWQKDTTFIADLKSENRVDIEYTLNSASSAVITITNFGNETYSLEEDADSNETTTEPSSGGCTDISVAES
ncbi:MAG TPA: phage tail tube protein [Nitrososphaeraceae archaeon]|nr:phage tail tube protein [Nitrososphaeraceae archaeon]